MTEEEIIRAAWRELLSGAESALDDWVDEEGEYGAYADKVYNRQRALLADLKRQERAQ